MTLLRNFINASILGLSVLVVSCNGGGETDRENPPVQQDTLVKKSETIDLMSGNIAKDPDNASLYHQRAKQYITEMGDRKPDSEVGKAYLQRAYADMQKAVELEAENAGYHFGLAEIAFELNEISAAQTALKESVRIKPDNQDAWLLLYKIQFALKDYETAKKTLYQMAQGAGESAELHFSRGMIFKYTLDTNMAIQAFQKAVALDNDYYDAYAQLGMMLAERKDGRALDYLKNALRIRPNSSEVLYARGKFYQDVGHYDAAVDDYQKILDEEPDYAVAIYNIGWINFRLDRYEKAIQVFEAAIRANPHYPDAHYMKGAAHEALGQLPQAIESYRECLRIDPNHNRAKQGLEFLTKK